MKSTGPPFGGTPMAIKNPRRPRDRVQEIVNDTCRLLNEGDKHQAVEQFTTWQEWGLGAMGVHIPGGFRKMGVPLNYQFLWDFNGICPYKATILRYPQFMEAPISSQFLWGAKGLLRVSQPNLSMIK